MRHNLLSALHTFTTTQGIDQGGHLSTVHEGPPLPPAPWHCSLTSFNEAAVKPEPVPGVSFHPHSSETTSETAWWLHRISNAGGRRRPRTYRWEVMPRCTRGRIGARLGLLPHYVGFKGEATLFRQTGQVYFISNDVTVRCGHMITIKLHLIFAHRFIDCPSRK